MALELTREAISDLHKTTDMKSNEISFIDLNNRTNNVVYTLKAIHIREEIIKELGAPKFTL